MQKALPLVATCLLLVGVIGDKSDIAPDWAAKIARSDALFTADDRNLTWRQVPPLGNGMIGTAPGSPLIHLQGVVSNNTRAWLTSQLPSASLSSKNMSLAGALLDLREGTYLRRYHAASGCDFLLEQRWFAHRKLPALFVMEVEVNIPCGCKWLGSRLTVSVSQRIAPPPPGVNPGGVCKPGSKVDGIGGQIDNKVCKKTTIRMETVANTTASGHAAVVSVGTTLEPEGDMPIINVSRVETAVPPRLEFSAATCGAPQTQRFVSAIRSSVSTPGAVTGSDVRAAAERDYDAAMVAEGDALRNAHVEAMSALWESGIEVGDSELAPVVNSSLYILLTGLRAMYNFSCCPTGLSDSGWFGTAFADCELWHEPPLLMLHPAIAKSMRAFRFNGLKQAMDNAKRYANPLLGRLTIDGARFPWQATAHGFEGSSTVFSHWVKYEMHISADIAFAHMNYFLATGDEDWLRANYPLLREVAVYHQSRVTKGPLQGAGRSPAAAVTLDTSHLERSPSNAVPEYHVLGAMGPDEYNYNITDPAFTMAAMQITLRFAAKAARIAGDTSAPTTEWLDIADHLAIPQYNATLGCTPEYRGYPPAVSSRGRTHRIKQADQVMMTYPLNCNQTKKVIHANAIYYGDACVHGPAMTWPMNTIGFLRAGDAQNATKYFRKSYLEYREQPFGVWSEMGVGAGNPHFATAPGGFLQGLINGYAGVQLREGSLGLRMVLPAGIPSLTLRKVHYHNCTFSAQLMAGVVTVSPVGDTSSPRHCLIVTGSDGVAHKLNRRLEFREDESITISPGGEC